MKDILEIVKFLEDSGKLLKGVSETIKNEAKKQKGGFLGMLLGTLGASLLGNMLAGKGFIRAGEGTARVGYGSKSSSFKKSFLIPPHPLTKFEKTLWLQIQQRFYILLLYPVTLSYKLGNSRKLVLRGRTKLQIRGIFITQSNIYDE